MATITDEMLTMEHAISDRLRTAVTLEKRGVDSFRVATPFHFADGDELKIILVRTPDGKWKITDEGHTLMYLSYYNFDVSTDTRASVMRSILDSHYMNDEDGRLTITAYSDEEAASAIFTFAQGLLKVSDMTMWKNERKKSLFTEEFKSSVTIGARGRRLVFDYNDEQADPQRLYPVDCAVTMKNGKIAHVYGAGSVEKARNTIIYMSYYEHIKIYVPNCVVLFEPMNYGKTRQQLEDFADKILSSPKTAEERLDMFFRKYEDNAA